MRSIKLLSILVIAFAFAVTIRPAVHADPMGINPSEDAYVQSDTEADKTQTHDGLGLRLRVGDCSAVPPPITRIAYMKFDVTGLAADPSRVLKVDLRSQVPNVTGATVSAYRITNDGWSATTLTWNNQPGTVDANGHLPSGDIIAQTTVGSTAPTVLTFDDDQLRTFLVNEAGGDKTASIALAITNCGPNAQFALIQVYQDQEQSQSGQPPLSVNLVSFVADAVGRNIVLTWTTASEISNEGFNLYRSEAEDGEYVRINDALIPAQGNPSTGASYSFTDTDVKPGRTYYYKLEDVDTSGVSTFHGPVSATVRGKGR